VSKYELNVPLDTLTGHFRDDHAVPLVLTNKKHRKPSTVFLSTINADTKTKIPNPPGR